MGRERPKILEEAFKNAKCINIIMERWSSYYRKCMKNNYDHMPVNIQVDFNGNIFSCPLPPDCDGAVVDIWVMPQLWGGFIKYFINKLPSFVVCLWCYYPKEQNDFDFIKNLAYAAVKIGCIDFKFFNDKGIEVQPDC